KLTAVLWAGNANFFKPGFRVSARWEVGAGNEFSESPVTDDQLAAIFGTATSNFFWLTLRDRYFRLCLFEIFRKRMIELVHYLHPLGLAIGDHIEIFFHTSCELIINNIGKVFHHQLLDLCSNFRWHESLLFTDHISALLNGRNRRRVRGWTADAIFLESLNERSL